MRRRALLANVGGLLAAGAAGCLAGGSDSPGGAPGGDGTTTGDPTTGDPTTDDPTTTQDPTTTDDPTTTEDPDGSLNWGPDTPEPFETATVGSRDAVAFPDNNKAHTVRVWNGASESRSIGLVLTAGGRTVVFDRTYEFPADGWIRLTLNEPAAYELAVTVGGDRAGAVTVERDRFDCNDSVTNVAVNAEGAVDSTTVSTAVACPGPEIAGKSFAVGEGGCGTRDDATATFADGAVGVEGAIRTPDPCHELALSAARLLRAERYADGGDDVLELVVTAEEAEEEMCVQCVGSIEYEATVEFANEYPSRVRVVHESMDDRRVVLETRR